MADGAVGGIVTAFVGASSTADGGAAGQGTGAASGVFQAVLAPGAVPVASAR